MSKHALLSSALSGAWNILVSIYIYTLYNVDSIIQLTDLL